MSYCFSFITTELPSKSFPVDWCPALSFCGVVITVEMTVFCLFPFCHPSNWFAPQKIKCSNNKVFLKLKNGFFFLLLRTCIVAVNSRNDDLCVECQNYDGYPVFSSLSTRHDWFHRRYFSISVMQHWRGEILASVVGLWRQTEMCLSAVSVWKSWNQIREGGPDTGVIWNRHYPQCTACLKRVRQPVRGSLRSH